MTQISGTSTDHGGIVDPGLPIVDAHHHFIPAMAYMPADFRRDMDCGHDIRASVFVEAGQMWRPDGPDYLRPVGETAFAAAAAQEFAAPGRDLCAGIVAHVDLRLGAAVEDVLTAHAEAAGGRLRGIRHSTFWDSEPDAYRFTISRPARGLLLDSGFRSGAARLSGFGLGYDAVVFHEQLDELVAFARALPETPVILNHMGFALGIGRFATRRQEVFAQWRAGLARLAACDNVCVKIGGLGMPFWGFGFHERETAAPAEELAAVWAPYIHAVIELFGPDRCMMESNFPPDQRSCSYVTCWNALKLATRDLSMSERHQLFHDTAVRVYRLAGLAA